MIFNPAVIPSTWKIIMHLLSSAAQHKSSGHITPLASSDAMSDREPEPAPPPQREAARAAREKNKAVQREIDRLRAKEMREKRKKRKKREASKKEGGLSTRWTKQPIIKNFPG